MTETRQHPGRHSSLVVVGNVIGSDGDRVQAGEGASRGAWAAPQTCVLEAVSVGLSGTGIAKCALSRGLTLACGSGYGIIFGRRNKRHRGSAHEDDENQLERYIVGWATMDTKQPQAGGELPSGERAHGEARIDYRRSNFYRMIRIDGVHGGIGPTPNMISMSIFSQMRPVPDSETYSFEHGTMKERKSQEGADAIISREIEVGAVLDIPTARMMRDWLSEKITAAEELVKDAMKESK